MRTFFQFLESGLKQSLSHFSGDDEQIFLAPDVIQDYNLTLDDINKWVLEPVHIICGKLRNLIKKYSDIEPTLDDLIGCIGFLYHLRIRTSKDATDLINISAEMKTLYNIISSVHDGDEDPYLVTIIPEFESKFREFTRLMEELISKVAIIPKAHSLFKPYGIDYQKEIAKKDFQELVNKYYSQLTQAQRLHALTQVQNGLASIINSNNQPAFLAYLYNLQPPQIRNFDWNSLKPPIQILPPDLRKLLNIILQS